MLTLVLLAMLPQQIGAEVTEAPERRPLTEEDALFSIDGVSGPMQATTDLDGDGVADLVVERGSRLSENQARPGWGRIDAVSLQTGKTIHTVLPFRVRGKQWVVPTTRKRRMWDASGDIDRDGQSDVVIGQWREGEGYPCCGTVTVVAAKNGKQLQHTRGDAALDGYGYSVAFIGDVNGDGHDDYAVGAPQAWVEEQVLVNSKKGTPRSYSEFEQEMLDSRSEHPQLNPRSEHPGYVSVRSGSDGTELVRFRGVRAGHGFGTRVCAVGDMDGDGILDLGVGSANESEQEIQLISVAKREEICRLPSLGGPFETVGDVDGDGVPDLCQANLDSTKELHMRFVRIVSGSNRQKFFDLDIPDFWSGFTVTVGVGDVDGDGHDDIAIGEADYNIPGSRPGSGSKAPDIRSMSLKEVVEMGSSPWAICWDSGCAWVYSGRTQEVIWGAYGLPGTLKGMGLAVASIPDVNDDNLPDLVVTDQDTVYVFAGPGRVK